MESKRLLAAIMFTDIVGYTAMMQKDEAQALIMRARHREVFKKFHKKYDGEIIQYFGDGTLSIFDSSVHAVNCAIDIQKELSMEPKVPLRIGIHSGDIIRTNDDIIGDGVNLASRIESLAVPGSVFISQQLQYQIKNHGINVHSMGLVQLKNVSSPIEVFAVKDKGLIVPDSFYSTQKLKPVENLTKLDFKKSIAILPFVNMSNDPEQEYFCDGISEELINSLVKIEGLKVAGRTSSFSFKGKNEDLKSIGKSLEVKTILEGSVRKSGNRLRITAQLISTENGFHLWSEVYDREMVEIFSIQDEITTSITEELKVHLKNKNIRHDNHYAYDAYLKGRFHNHMTDMEKALKYYNLALEIDPDYALPYTGIGDIWGQVGVMGFVPAHQSFSIGKPAAMKGLKLNDQLAEAHEIRSRYYFFYEWDWVSAEKASKHAIKLGPNNPDAGFTYFWLLLVAGRFKEAHVQVERILKLDSLNVIFQALLAWLLLFEDNLGDSMDIFQRAIAQEPKFPWPHSGLWSGYHKKGMTERAIVEAKQYLAMIGYPNVVEEMESVYQKVGYQAAMLQGADSLLILKKQRHVPLNLVARLYSMAGKNVLAIDWLEKSVEANEPWSVTLKVDVDWRNLHEESRFLKLLKRIGLE